MERLTIGQLAKKANVNLETIRYYERRGLLPAPPRNKSGHRRYSDKDLKRTIFIKQKVKAKLIDVEEKIETLQRMRQILIKLKNSCPGQGSLDECPILEALDQ